MARGNEAKAAATIKGATNLPSFYGMVTLTEWIHVHTGIQYMALVGQVSILEATTLVGFEIRHSPEANWVARIEGKTTCYYIPGCKVRAVAALGNEGANLAQGTVWAVP